MQKSILKAVHPIAGALALFTISLFWLSTAITELVGKESLIVAVKTAVPWGFFILVPALLAAAISGFRLGRNARSSLVKAKQKRMPIIALNGVLVLVPCAIFLAMKAKQGELDTSFYTVQALELVAGAINIILLCSMVRDGLRVRTH